MSYDGDTQALIAIRSRLPNAAHAAIDREIQGRAEAYRAGVRWAPRHLATRLRELDPQLRCRWDFAKGIPVIERWAAPTGSYAQVCEWPLGADGRPVSVGELIELLREGDMQRWPSPEAYLAHRRAKAARRRAEIERQSMDEVLAAVDSLGKKQVRQFLDVSEALATGDRITAHGDDEKFLDRAYARTQALAAQAAG